MANAMVDKLKALGLRQGEKIVVGIAATVFVVCLGAFVTKPTIQTTPAELQKKADDADSNLSRRQDPDAIIARIEGDGIKDPGFVKIVENQAANSLKPGDYRSRLDWVTPEPGAGLIRDEPVLIAPTELAAFPGRGGMPLFTLDDKGNRIVDTAALAAGGAGGQAGRRGAVGGGPAAGRPDQDKRQQDAEAKKRRLLAGAAPDAATAKDEAKKDDAAADPAETGPWKEDVKGKRWVVVTAVVDNEQMNKNWLTALKNPAIAFPQYLQVAAERQTLQDDGAWTAWTPVDENTRYKVIDNMTEKEEELVPEVKAPIQLVDPLPFLRAGYWTGVYVASLVPAEVLKAPEAAAAGGFAQGGSANSGMSRGGGGGAGGKFGGMMGGGGDGAEMRPGQGGSSSGGGAAAAAGPEEAVVANSEAKLMIRSIDFSVEPNATYRYRIRLVVKNPNFNRSDVNPGTDVTSEQLRGPWSEPTIAVAVPADVSAYAEQSAPDNARRDDVVMFEVFRWNPATGQTVVKTDDAAPGFLIGENGSVLEPTSEGGGAKSVTIDFNSRSVVLDSSGGRSRLPEIGVDRNQFEVPAVAIVVEPDGAVVIRDQADDRSDEIRQDMASNYRQAIKDSGKKREKGGGSARSGAMGMGQRGRAGQQRGGGRAGSM